MAKHTPTLWRFEMLGGELYIVSGYDPAKRVLRVADLHGGESAFSVEEQQENANFILRACNSHEDLVKAVQQVNALVRKAQDVLSLYLQPDGNADEAIEELLSLLDGPEQRVIQTQAFEILAKMKAGRDPAQGEGRTPEGEKP